MSTEILPGLIEPHAHPRDLGLQYKETFRTAWETAVVSGYTMMLVMPNTLPPISSPEMLAEERNVASGNLLGDTFLYYLAIDKNYDTFDRVAADVVGFKLFETHSTGGHEITDAKKLEPIYEAVTSTGRILSVHQEGSLKQTLDRAKRHKTKLNIVHLYTADQAQEVREAKMAGVDVTAEACDHHLIDLSDEQIAKLGPFFKMKPRRLPGQTQALWAAIADGTITMFGGDHAPHTWEEKMRFTEKDGPFGVPTLDTSMGIKLTWVAEGKLTLDQLKQMMYYSIKDRFNLPEQPGTFVEVDTDERWTVRNEVIRSKCGWTPYAGLELTGHALRTVIRNQEVYKYGQKNTVIPQGQVLTPVS